MRTSGAIGEVYTEGDCAMRDTQSQRSWMYTEDPLIQQRKGRVQTDLTEEEIDAMGNSIKMKAGVMPQPAPRKNDTIPRGVRIFADE